MVDRLKTITDTVDNWLVDRPTIARNNDDPINIAILLEGEISEFITSLLDHQINQTKESKKDVAQELSDVLIFTLQLFSALDLDVYMEVMEKIAFNTIRYDSKSFSNGVSYDDARANMKKYTLQRRLKEQFYDLD